MSGNAWVGQHVGKEDPRLVRISPFFYPQHKLLNVLYIPKLRDLPQDGLDLKGMVFDFGFNLGVASVDPKGTAKVNLQVERPLMIWGITGVSDSAAGFLVQFFHTHEGSQRQFFSKHINAAAVAGNGTNLLIVRYPYVVIRGDQLTAEVKNLDTVAAKIQVVLFGGEFD